MACLSKALGNRTQAPARSRCGQGGRMGLGGRGARHLHPGRRRDYLEGRVGRRATAGGPMKTNPKTNPTRLGAQETTVLSWLTCAANGLQWGVAQPAERLAVNQEVGGSNPPAPVGGSVGRERLSGLRSGRPFCHVCTLVCTLGAFWAQRPCPYRHPTTGFRHSPSHPPRWPQVVQCQNSRSAGPTSCWTCGPIRRPLERDSGRLTGSACASQPALGC